MPEKLEIDALRALKAIADCGGITRAAEHLALSQSAVSHKIKRLEEGLACKLLTRMAGAPIFTDAGETLLTYSDRMLNLHTEALLAVHRKPLVGQIRLGMTEDTATTGLSRILGRFTRLYPDITVRTHAAQSLTLNTQLDQNAIDLAVMQVFDTDIQPKDTILYWDRLHWVKSPELELDFSHPVPYLAFDQNCFYKHWAMKHGHPDHQEFKIVLECASTAGITASILSGLGVALLNKRHIISPMQIIDTHFPNPPGIAYVARIGHKSSSKAARALLDEIYTEFSKERF